MRRFVAMATLAACVIAGPMAVAQNDWQFPDPYFGAIEFDIAKPSGQRQRQRRVEPAPAPRPKTSRQRPYRARPRWSAQGMRP
jgi:hypothetical protein